MNIAPCPKCQSQLSFEVPEPFLLNHLLFSSLTICHERGVECTACGQYFVLGISSANVEYSVTPYERPSEIIIPRQRPMKLV